MIRRPAAIFWDLDGTLIDSIELIVRSYQHALITHLGATIAREEIVSIIGTSLPDDLERRAPGRGAELLETYRDFNNAHHAALVSVYAGVADALAAVQTLGVPQGLVTSKSRDPVELAFAQFDLARYLSIIVTHEDTIQHKPHPAPLLVAAARVRCAPQACWYIGDSTHDMLAARAAGMVAVAVTWGPYPRGVLEPLADLVVDTSDELVARVAATRRQAKWATRYPTPNGAS